MEQDKYNHQGLQYTFIGFDEGCQFLWSQIEYLMSRMRSKSKYSSRMVISCNPDADHELARFIDWWLDEDGYPDPDKCGVVRYFIRLDGDFIWADDPQELIDKYWVGPEQDPKRERVPKPVSTTFIGSTIFDNPVVLKDNPEYLSFLEGLPELEKAQLLYGNWKAKPEGSKSFTRSMIKYVDALPPDVVSVRAWDKAMTERTSGNRFPDFTACIKVSRDSDGRYYLSGDYHPEVFDGGDYSTQTAGRFCKRSGERDILIKKQAEYDGQDVTIVFPVDPGQAGGSEFLTSTRNLVNEGFRVEKDPMPTSRSKLTRFQPFCTLAYQGLVFIVRSSFDPKTLEAILKEMENFTGERSTRTRKDDFVDAISSGVNYLEKEDIVQPCVIPRLTAPTLFSKQRLI